MNIKSRIASIAKATSLDFSITGFPTFRLSDLILTDELDFELPTNVRLGHLAEKIVSELIKSSKNYKVIYENTQIIKNGQTIGEIDFILENLNKNELTHLELAYKFYLFDPTISDEPINNLIGPNRNDSLNEKLDKLKTKQFPILYHSCAKSEFSKIDINKVSQSLCLLASLFIPYEYNLKLPGAFEEAIQGYYVNLETFIDLNNSDKLYCLPSKKEWGMDPSENDFWTDFKGIEDQVKTCIIEKQAPMCWQKHNGNYLTFFIVWW